MDLDRVKRILTGSEFINGSKEHQDQIIESLLTYIDRDMLRRVFNQIRNDKYYANDFGKLDYGAFYSLVEAGNINGRDLLNLCPLNTRLQRYCNKNNQAIYSEALQNKSLNNLTYLTPRQRVEIETNGGEVWTFGYSQLTLIGKNKYIPTEIPVLNNIVAISSFVHSLLLDNEGKVWSFGDGEYGQLGLGDDNNKNIPTQIHNLSGIVAISTGIFRSLVL